MAGVISLKTDTRDLTSAVFRLSGIANTTLDQAWRRGLRSLARRVVGITPPAQSASNPPPGSSASPRGAGGTITTEDKARGERALGRDLGYIFEPVTWDSGASQDIAAIHRRLFIANKKAGRPLRNDLGRGKRYFANVSDLLSLESKLRRKVGRLAGQWNSGVNALGIKSPAWVARHGTANGRHRVIFGFLKYRFEMAATDVPSELVGELNRRLGYAANYTAKSLERESNFLLLKAAGRAGFQTRA